MPTYDYVCSACSHEMEVVHGVHGHGPSACPVCGGPMRKTFAAPTIHFKGSGWAKKERGSSHAPTAKPTGPKSDTTHDAADSGSGAASSGPSSDGSGAGAAGDAAASRPD